jgi:hypothetical protein
MVGVGLCVMDGAFVSCGEQDVCSGRRDHPQPSHESWLERRDTQTVKTIAQALVGKVVDIVHGCTACYQLL